ncbi:ABC transporter ATP-binding protein [Salininema proteolyticum]|uniref:ABC transporter ATP-binding protein n=1 Tax=Salininema proteolyticum TaxID=1607685 RepID=A0ABV8U015_9ACTN
MSRSVRRDDPEPDAEAVKERTETAETGDGADTPATTEDRTDKRLLRRGLKNIRDAVRLEPKLFTVAVTGAIVNSATQIGASFAVGYIVTGVVVPSYRQQEFLTGTVVLGILALFALSLIRFTSMATRRIFAGAMMFQVQAHYRRAVTRRYLSLPISWHQKRQTGTLLSNANADVEAATRPLAPLPFAFGTAFMIIASVAVLFSLDWALALVALLLVPALFTLNGVYATRMSPRAKRAQELRAEVSAVAHESFDGALVVKAMGREEQETRRFRDSAQRLRDALIRVGRIRAAFEPVITALPEIASVAVLLVGLYRYQSGNLTLEQLVTATFLFTVIAFPIRAIGWVLGEIPTSVVGRDRVDRVISAKGDMTYGEKHLDAEHAAELRFDHVAYTYPDGTSALDDVSFTIEHGETVALVGATGSGKSTIAHLATRLVDPTRGRVELDGHDTLGLSHASLAESASLVTQIPFVFDDTVRHNITLEREGVTDRDVDEALAAAQADGFIADLAEGVDTELGERGTSLSGGQRQRLTIARALAGRPRLMILDDATSAVDPKVEAAILTGLKDSGQATSVLVVAYRRASISLADKVVFLKDGRVADIGTHTDLLERNGAYADLVTAYEQAEAEREFEEEETKA